MLRCVRVDKIIYIVIYIIYIIEIAAINHHCACLIERSILRLGELFHALLILCDNVAVFIRVFNGVLSRTFCNTTAP